MSLATGINYRSRNERTCVGTKMRLVSQPWIFNPSFDHSLRVVTTSGNLAGVDLPKKLHIEKW